VKSDTHTPAAPPGPSSRPTLSVCMIVKNEEQFLARCLDSVATVADEIIVVDTGSTDSTVDIARRYTDRVYHHTWRDSFSEARNASLSYATCDWILQIDADEELYREDIPLLRRTLAEVHGRAEVNAVLMPILNELSGGRVAKHYFKRLFRRGKAHFEGIVHNQLIHEGAAATGAEIRIRHYGYNLTDEQMEAKLARSERLLLRQTEERPEDTFAWMNLIRNWRNQGRLDEVVREGLRVADSPQAMPVTRQTILCDVVACLAAQRRLEKALAVGRRVLKENPKHLDLLFLCGVASYESGDMREALGFFRRYLAVKAEEERRGATYTGLILDYYDAVADAWLYIGRIHECEGRTAEAIGAYRRSMEHNERLGDAYVALAALHSSAGELDLAQQVLNRGVTACPDGVRLWLMLGDCCRSCGQYDESLAAFRRALELVPDNGAPWFGSALTLMRQERWDQALECLGRAEVAMGPSTALLLARVRAEVATGRLHEAEQTLESLLGRPLSDGEVLLVAREAISVGAYERGKRALELYLQDHPKDLSALLDVATCYAKMGRYEAALEGYRAAAEVAPDDPRVRRSLREFEALIRQVSPTR